MFFEKAGISSSMITEITKGRSQVGIKIIHRTVFTFNELNVGWLLTGEEEAPYPAGNAEKLLSAKDAIIAAQQETIQSLKEALAVYKKKK